MAGGPSSRRPRAGSRPGRGPSPGGGRRARRAHVRAAAAGRSTASWLVRSSCDGRASRGLGLCCSAGETTRLRLARLGGRRRSTPSDDILRRPSQASPSFEQPESPLQQSCRDREDRTRAQPADLKAVRRDLGFDPVSSLLLRPETRAESACPWPTSRCAATAAAASTACLRSAWSDARLLPAAASADELRPAATVCATGPPAAVSRLAGTAGRHALHKPARRPANVSASRPAAILSSATSVAAAAAATTAGEAASTAGPGSCPEHVSAGSRRPAGIPDGALPRAAACRPEQAGAASRPAPVHDHTLIRSAAALHDPRPGGSDDSSARGDVGWASPSLCANCQPAQPQRPGVLHVVRLAPADGRLAPHAAHPSELVDGRRRQPGLAQGRPSARAPARSCQLRRERQGSDGRLVVRERERGGVGRVEGGAGRQLWRPRRPDGRQEQKDCRSAR